MFQIPRRMRAAWLVMFGIVTLVAGCGQDAASPLGQPPDTAPPNAPTSLVVTTQTDTKFSIEWAPCGEPNVVGYIVYRYDPDPSRLLAYVPMNQNPIPGTRLTVSGSSGTTYYFRVAAVDITTKESAMSEPLTFTFQTSQGYGEFGDNGDGNAIWQGGNESGPNRPNQEHSIGELPIEK